MKAINIDKLKIFIIAGEVSGDVLGAKIMHEMPKNVEFIGVGGKNMINAGLKSLFPISDLSVMGVFEVLAHAKTLKARIKQTIDAILVEKPDIVLTIDSPGFAKAVIGGVRKRKLLHRTKFYHVVAPQVWAWGERRAKKYAKIFDKLYAFFDFEIPYFAKYGLKTIAVGHPIADGLDKYRADEHGEKTIVLVPGSRMSEVKRLLPVFQKTVDMLVRCGYKDYKFVIPVVETTEQYIRNNVKNWSVVPEIVSSGERYNVYANAYIAIVASGTVSAELAIMHIPTIVVYKMNPLTVMLAHILLKVKWASLVNILMNKTIFPELLGKKANPCAIMDLVQQLSLPSVRQKMINELKQADVLWRHDSTNPAMLIVKDILKS
ncbi:MAG: lipid-A-disaccharide synthase [Alphaproteobacteria bacterium]|nr:lipid-A-disaccharide synthase [Alphaproteobacteria bacterium]